MSQAAPVATHCLSLFLRIRPERIGFFRFILESYDGLAIASTIDCRQGLLRVAVPRENYNELLALVADLSPGLCPKKGRTPFLNLPI